MPHSLWLAFQQADTWHYGQFRKAVDSWRSPTLSELEQRFFPYKMKRTSYLIQMVCMWKIQHPRVGCSQALGWCENTRVKALLSAKRPKPHCASNAAQLLWPWWHDSNFLYLGLFICKMEIVYWLHETNKPVQGRQVKTLLNKPVDVNYHIVYNSWVSQGLRSHQMGQDQGKVRANG